MFKTNQKKITEEPSDNKEIKIVKFDDEETRVVEDFDFKNIKVPGEKDYKKIREKYGSFASTDTDRVIKNQKDARFFVSPLLKSALEIDQEEKKVIEQMVQDRISAVSEEAKKVASEKGYAEGFKKAEEDAMVQFRGEIQDKIEKIEELLAGFEKAKLRIFEENEKFIVDLIFSICRTILFREVKDDREYVVQLAKSLIERVGVKDNITLKVHPSNINNLENIKEEIVKTFADLKNINIVTDASIKAGGCIVESEWNAINATIDTQIKKIYESVSGRQMQDPKGAEAKQSNEENTDSESETSLEALDSSDTDQTQAQDSEDSSEVQDDLNDIGDSDTDSDDGSKE